MTIDELLQLAIKNQQKGNLDDAAKLYGVILTHVPDHADALHYLGMLVHQKGESENGAGLIEKSLAINPDQPDALNNLGNIYRLLGHDDDAMRAYWGAVQVDPAHYNAWGNMAVVYRTRNDPKSAAKVLQIALTFNPNDHAAMHYQVLVYLDLRNFEVAEKIALTLIRDDHYKGNVPALYANALDYLGKPEEALRVLLEWQKKNPDDPVVEHHVNAQRGDNPAAASETYVRKTFDEFAESFEGVLKGLGYDAPEVLAQAVADQFKARRIARAVDLGCGTGLLGPLIKPNVDHLTGVDLSPNMLIRAKAKQVYDEIAEKELTSFLNEQQADAFDLVTAAEVLNYIGDLEPVFAAISRSLKSGGAFIGTFEILEDDDSTGYRLTPTGRYEHREDYVLSLAEQSGLHHVETKRIPLRKHFNDIVEGLVITFSASP